MSPEKATLPGPADTSSPPREAISPAKTPSNPLNLVAKNRCVGMRPSYATAGEGVVPVALLARLSLPEAEADRLRVQLSAILDYVKQLDRLDTRDVVPTSHAAEKGTPFRDDAVRPFGDKEAILANAPDRVADFFRVPRILEHSD